MFTKDIEDFKKYSVSDILVNTISKKFSSLIFLCLSNKILAYAAIMYYSDTYNYFFHDFT